MRAAVVAWHVVRRLPQPLLASSAAGWALVASQDVVPSLPTLCLSSTTVAETATIRLAVAFAVTASPVLALAWLAMMLAMMPPLLVSPLLHVWRRSLPRRRIRAVPLFVLGYVLVWFAAGSLLVPASLVLGSVAPAAGLPPVAAAALIALAWQATPLKQMSLNRCHGRPPLAAFGVRAEVDALRYGANHGIRCVGACWALMLLTLAANGLLHWTMMAAVMLISVVERALAPNPPRWGAAWPRLPQPSRASLYGMIIGSVAAERDQVKCLNNRLEDYTGS